jgi:hypothetical protein
MTYLVRYDPLMNPTETPIAVALFVVAALIFGALAWVVHVVTERRRFRRTRQQWKERERLLDRER